MSIMQKFLQLAVMIAPPSMVWLKSKNPASAAVGREREEEWR